MPMTQNDYTELKNRLENLSAALKGSSYDALYLTDPKFLEYYTGYPLSYGALLSYKSGKTLLFLDGRYFTMVEESDLWIKIAIESSLNEAFLTDIGKNRGEYHIAFQGDTLSYEMGSILLEKSPKNITLSSDSKLFSQLRRRKSQKEQEAIQKAALLCEKGFLYAIQQLKIGVSEEEISKKLILYWLKEGAKGPCFDPIIAFGKNSASPHWRASSTLLEEGDIVLIDIGVSAYGYASDMTRTFSFGEPKVPFFDMWFDATYRALQEAERVAKAGVSCSLVDTAAREALCAFGWEKNFTHGLGHGVGLDVHEAPRLSKISTESLLLGDVITLEPGLYFQEKGGVRLENSYLVHENGVEACIKLPFFPRLSRFLS